MTKLVYLDSSDFSNLSAPDTQLSAESRTILELLREHRRAGTATFFISVIHICEAVHAAEAHKEAAVRRAKLMRELCGTNILRIPTDLPTMELRKALASEKASLSLDDIRSAPGEWFGVNIPLDDMPSQRASIRQKLDAAVSNLPRRERRKRRSELSFKKTTSRERWRELMRNGARSFVIPYPYNLLEPDFSISWFLGEISDAEYRQKVIQIVHDPYILFEYLLNEGKLRETLYESLRKASRDLTDESSDRQLIYGLLPLAKSEIAPDLASYANKFVSRAATLRQIVSSFDAKIADQIADDDLSKIISKCPSLFAIIEVYKAIFKSRAYSYFTRVRAGNSDVKESNASDFGDIMHCHYAPYFDVFRCDARFGAHLKTHGPIRAQIADRIGDLPRMLSSSSQKMGREVA